MSTNNSSNKQWEHLVKSQNTHSKQDNGENIDLINSYFFLFDCFENKILFVNSNFEILTGYNSLDFTLEFLLSIIHPDDIQHFYACEERGLKFTNSLSFNEHYKYILSYSYRIRKSDGDYIRIIQQCQGIDVNTKGDLTKTLVKHIVITEETEDVKAYKIYDKTKGVFIDGNNIFNLTKREIEIIHLVNDGFSSEEIAEKLFISKNTIITHRRNILNKTNSSSFFELIQKMRVSSLIE